MKRITRLLSFLLAFVILLGATPFSATASASGDYEYTVNEDGTVTITAYNGTDADVVIPAQINGADVTVIGENAFKNTASLISVSFPETLTTIEPNAFEACTSLKAVVFPDSLTSVGDYAFFNCGSLNSVTSTPYLYDIGTHAFHNTSWYINAPLGFLYVGRVLYRYIGLTDDNAVIQVPDYTAAIAPNAFEGQYRIDKILLPVGIRRIGTFAFKNCYNISEIRIPPSVTVIGEHAFFNAGPVLKGAAESTIDSYATEQKLPFEVDNTLDYLDGDMDKDGEVSSSDIRVMMKAVVLSEDCDHERFLSCDIVYDGKITTGDIREWMQLTIA
ncbi:MAG: hypothetical protein E7553_00100 [Ruminococcaceae bacterium]|nr:hypothetical protein [Oscillospiraceae bacterium]